ncbi:ANTAR domain-containing protein [Actinoplanes sp. NPDC089786]|uniref:ANTAR domain-containing protein n=1 Tax=Actinoplanes sp. NPDC089786 TaxID=3155185 RepID=UPI0034413A59
MSTPREQTLADAFVELTDTLVADFDIVEFLHLLTRRCVELLGVEAAGIMVADQRGALRVMASSSEQAHLLELFEVESDQGPCVDCYTTRAPVADLDLDHPDPKWREFAGRARRSGFRAVHAVPVRLRDEVIGVLNLFSATPGPLGDDASGAARAIANVTTMGLLQHRAVEYRQVLAEQLQHAMNSRVVIEQAKGLLAELLGLDMAAAFDELRRYAALLGRRLGDVAAMVAAGDHGPDPAERAGLPRVLLIRRFDMNTLTRLRDAVAAATARHGLREAQVDHFVLAVHEAASNAVRHGGGTGQVLLWRLDGAIYAEISDNGPGFADRNLITPTEPRISAPGGLGRWLISQTSTVRTLDTGGAGTRLLLSHPLDTPHSGPGGR